MLFNITFLGIWSTLHGAFFILVQEGSRKASSNPTKKRSYNDGLLTEFQNYPEILQMQVSKQSLITY